MKKMYLQTFFIVGLILFIGYAVLTSTPSKIEVDSGSYTLRRFGEFVDPKTGVMYRVRKTEFLDKSNQKVYQISVVQTDHKRHEGTLAYFDGATSKYLQGTSWYLSSRDQQVHEVYSWRKINELLQVVIENQKLLK
jgi:hypothetical protein